MELRNVRDTYSVASLFPKLRVEASRRQAFSGSRAWLRKLGQSHGKNAYDSCLPKAVSVLGCFLATYISWITDGSSRGPGWAIMQRDVRIPLVNTRSAMHGSRLAPWYGYRRRETVTWWKSSRPGITWRRRERGGVTAKGSLVPRLHLPNVWEVESGNEASQMTYSDDVIAHH